MNDYKSLRKTASARTLSIVLIILILLEICSLAVLFSRLSIWSQRENENVFSLIESSDITNVRVGRISPDGTIKFYEQASIKASSKEEPISSFDSDVVLLDTTVTPTPEQNSQNTKPAPSNPGFEVMGNGTVWAGETNVEIFKISYVNGENKVTVEGGNGNKVIAPGTSNTYSFTLKNTGDVSLDYKMSMEASVTGTDLRIPVVVRVYDHDGDFCLGEEELWEDVLELDKVQKEGTLAADRFANYTLEWMWPFEGNDDYDTMLGNLAKENDLTLTIKISTYAEESEDKDDPGDNPPPQTGDEVTDYIIWASIAVAVGVIIVVYGKKVSRRKEFYE